MLRANRILSVAAFALLLSLAAGTVRAAPPQDTRTRLAELGGVPCPASGYTCVTLTVPLDHFNPSDPRTLDVVFAVLPATGTRKGMFVTATGGPGTAGILLAEPYTVYFSQALYEHFDLVFFDQRGMGLSGGLTCPRATAPYYLANLDADTPKHIAKQKRAAQKYAIKCDAESGHSDLLPYLGTAQAIEDLEAFRAAMGDDKFWLYGESYATQYAQTYAHAHGEHLAGMILDGTVDLTLDGIPYYAQAAQSFNDTLVATLDKCAATPECLADFGGAPLSKYDALVSELSKGVEKVTFPLGNGKWVKRPFGLGNLEFNGVSAMYGLSGRMLFTRALAAYARDGDLIPMLRLLYSNAVVNPMNLKPVVDPSWSDAAYYDVECQDYGYFAGTSDARADQFIAEANPIVQSGIRLASVIYGDFPCVYWRDSAQAVSRPPHWDAHGIPTLVLNALLDPITPIGSARAVYAHLDDGYLVTQRGGPHVIFGRGYGCIDNLVTDFLVNDQLPAQRATECPGKIMYPYVPLAPLDASSFDSALSALESAETEINYLPEYWYWDYVTPTRVGCARQGTLAFEPSGEQVKFKLSRCAVSKGFNMTGTGYYDFGTDRFWLDLTVEGYQSCTLRYDRVGTQASIDGACAGTRVTVSGAAQPYQKPTFSELKASRRAR